MVSLTENNFSKIIIKKCYLEETRVKSFSDPDLKTLEIVWPVIYPMRMQGMNCFSELYWSLFGNFLILNQMPNLWGTKSNVIIGMLNIVSFFRL